MKTIREVDQLDDAEGTPHVRVDVLLMPSDRKTVAGLVTMRSDPKHQVSLGKSGLPIEIEAARSRAWAIARERGIEVIWINDPKGLYPSGERAQQVGIVRHVLVNKDCGPNSTV